VRDKKNSLLFDIEKRLDVILACFVDPHKVVARKMHFQFLQVHENFEKKKRKKKREKR
jgi:hypothetical protein